MAAPLLRTKFYPPAARPEAVPRPHLYRRLDEGARAGLTLVAAPAGFGKSTLVGSWIAAGARQAAWLSLDEADNDPSRFWTYVIGALQTVDPELGRTAQALLQAPQPSPFDVVLTALINELTTADGACVLVLDDYHLIAAAAVHETFAFFLEHHPPVLQIVLLSRNDPPLPLTRLRAGGRLVELRADALRFSPDESHVFLKRVIGAPLSARDAEALTQRTEGWVAGLQLAGLALQGRDDAEAFVAAFTGSHHYVGDYLTEEVFRRQPPDWQQFMLDTSILRRLSGSLCAAVTEREDAAVCLGAMSRANLFLIPLDASRQWYRYHHLFGDLLRHRLLQTAPDRAAGLHRRAFAWYGAQGDVDEALYHALEAGALDEAVALIEAVAQDVLKRGHLITLKRWIEGLPVEVVRKRPLLNVYLAWVYNLRGEAATVAYLLEAAEQALAAGSFDTATRALTRSNVANIRALDAHRRGDAHAQIAYLKDALTEVPESERDTRSIIEMNMGVAQMSLRAYDAAIVHLQAGRTLGFQSESYYTALVSCFIEAHVHSIQGRLDRAVRICREAIEAMAGTPDDADGAALRAYPPLAYAYVGLGGFLYEQNKPAAARFLEQGLQHGEALFRIALYGYGRLAWLRHRQGRTDEALEVLDRADDLAERMQTNVWKMERTAVRVRIWLDRRDLEAAARWAAVYAARPGDRREPDVERCDIVYARVLRAQGRHEQALSVLKETEGALVACGAVGRRLGLLVTRALILDDGGYADRALAALGEALRPAATAGYVRTFADEGSPVARLLTRWLAGAGPVDRPEARFAGDVLALLNDEADRPPLGLDEALSEREIDVLRLIAGGLTNQAIADQLFVTVGTIKKHTHNIYQKLGVSRRTEALRRARDLKLV